MADEWSNWPRVRPKSKDQRAAYLAELTGAPPGVRNRSMPLKSNWMPSGLRSSSRPPSTLRGPRPLREDRLRVPRRETGGGDRHQPDRPADRGPADGECRTGRSPRTGWPHDPTSTPARFVSEVTAAGPLSPPQAAAIGRFLAGGSDRRPVRAGSPTSPSASWAPSPPSRPSDCSPDSAGSSSGGRPSAASSSWPTSPNIPGPATTPSRGPPSGGSTSTSSSPS